MKKKNRAVFRCERLLLGFVAIIVCIFISCKGSTQHPEQENTKSVITQKLKGATSNTTLEQYIKEYHSDNNTIGEILALKELAIRYRDSLKFGHSLTYFNQALSLSEIDQDTTEIISITNEIGNNYRGMHILNKSLGWHRYALEMSNTYNDKNSLESTINRLNSLKGIGCTQYELRNLTAADSAFKKCLGGYRQKGMHVEEASINTYLGKIFETKRQNDSALFYYSCALKQQGQGGTNTDRGIAYLNIGHVLENMGDNLDAAKYFGIAYNLINKATNIEHSIQASLSIAQINIKLGKLSEVATYLNFALWKAQKLHSFSLMSALYKIRSLYDQKSGNTNQALLDLQQAQIFSDSMYAKIENERNFYLKLSYDQQQKQKKQLESSEQVETLKKRNLHWAIGIMITILLLSAGAITILVYFLRLRRRAAKMQDHMEAVKNNFFTNVTHEFRTPLTVILGFSREFLTTKSINVDEWREKIAIIERQGKGLLQLINQLLEISKIHATIGEAEWKQGNINPYIRMIIENYGQLTKEKQIKMVFSPEKPILQMDFVPQYIHQIIANLISNAIKYTPRYGHIYITTSDSHNVFTLTVNDSGCGIPKEEQKHIFEIFYQGQNSCDKIGTGVGLSLVQQMVEAMNGIVNVISDTGEGSSFIIRIPLRHGVQQWDAFTPKNVLNDANNQEEQKDESEPESKSNILIIEDHSDVAYYIGSCFKGEYSLHYALNGEEGLAKAKEVMPDLIITDLMMPGIGGLEVCRRIRASQILSHIPIIIITARNTDEDRIKGLKTGADAYLAKPFNAEELTIRVKNLLEQRQQLRDKFLKSIHEGDENHAILSDLDKDFIKIFTKNVFAHTCGNTISIETLAESMNMTTIQLNRKIRAITGQTTIAYVLQLRMSKAKKLLDSDDSLAIAEVASKCGYEITYFSRIFKQTIGLSPMQYRNKKKRHNYDKQ